MSGDSVTGERAQGDDAWSAESDFPSRLGAHMPFLEAVLAAAAKRGWDGRDFFGLQMTLEETLTNAIRHGNCCEEAKRVSAECRLDDRHFWLTVEDEGKGFDLQSIRDCRADENLERLGGRGMLLIHAYMAEVTFNDRGNRIEVSTHRGFVPPESGIELSD